MHILNLNLKEKTKIETLMIEHGLFGYAAKVNGRLRELNYVCDGNVDIEFLDLSHDEVMRMYETTLRYLISKVIYEINPSYQITFNYSFSRAIYLEVEGLNESKEVFLNDVLKRLTLLIEQKLPIIRKTITKEDAIKMYTSMGKLDKINIYPFRKELESHVYQCGSYTNYLYGYMLSNTSYMKAYQIFIFQKGFMIQYPRAEFKGFIPPFEYEDKYKQALKHASKWHQLIEGEKIHHINSYATSKEKAVTLIQMSESRHQAMLYEVSEDIRNKYHTLKLISIAGPSSSGKTTFAKRLRIELIARGLHPVMISLDDYYVSSDQIIHFIDGKPDLEHIEALDLKLFNTHLTNLIEGKTVTLPHFDFMTKTRKDGPTLTLKPNEVILIEGIHALNPRLTEALSKSQMYQIYIGLQSQLHIDSETPIRISDIRLLRRIVRDIVFRDTPAEKTFDMWTSVRHGEFKWIYPYQKYADYVFNSALTYEIAILKKHALKHLKDIKDTSPYYMKANYLIKFLKYTVDMDDDLVPNQSLLREFIGGSVF